MATIRQIDGRTIHQIQSGQVIVDLCSVVKELVENSIDAGSTNIDVRFKNQGLDLIEVQDNGSGISSVNYATVALKHHTSKLSSYADIASLQTFGFRGEALASLCALSTLFVTTCLAADAPKGSKLSFEPSGKLKSTAVVAAQRGTTVSVEKLFHNLPVRRRELERNIKREWHKVIALLNQYACIQTNLKFSVSQQPTKGKRIVMFSTKGNPSTRDNIINIFGAKTMTALVPIDLALEMRPSPVGPNASTLPTSGAVSKEVRVVGHVSRPAHGEGRQTPDRQMFFVNGRPCGLPQFAKTFNEVYRTYNSSQSPFILADIQIDTHMYDVNVSPDKRSILLHDQNHLLDGLRASLLESFDGHDYTVPVARTPKSHTPMLARASTPKSGGTGIQSNSMASSRSLTEEGSDDGGDHDDHDDDGNDDEDDGARTARQSSPRIHHISSRALPKVGRHQNLISQWVDRKPQPGSLASRQSTSASSDGDMPKSTPQQVAPNFSAPTSPSNEASNPKDVSLDETLGGDSDDSEIASSSNKVLSRLPFHDVTHPAAATAPTSPCSATEATSDHEESGMPVTTPLRLLNANTGQLRVEKFPKRLARDPPTVVIGDQVISQTSSPKRVRRSGSQEAAHKVAPSFGSALSQLYSAGSVSKSKMTKQSEPASEERETSEEAGEMTPSSCSSASVRSKHADPPAANSVAESSDDQSSEASPGPAENEQSRRESTPAAVGPVAVNSSCEGGVAEPRADFFQGGTRRKGATLQSIQKCHIDEEYVQSVMYQWIRGGSTASAPGSPSNAVEDINAPDAESKLSLIISRSDFAKMRVAGQFNMGFIIAVRPGKYDQDSCDAPESDELFIIDQHASDEKYNYERLQASTVVQSQRLVHPKRLELTALEEEIVMHNMTAIESNGFKIDMDTSGESAVGSRCQLLALPLSRETTFSLADLEELVSLLGDESSESMHIPRPSKVRKMFAMRACRSSIMIGKAMTAGQMHTLVRHMGELDKPWNCPHGRPTMRHLCQLQVWDDKGWKDDVTSNSASLWRRYTSES